MKHRRILGAVDLSMVLSVAGFVGLAAVGYGLVSGQSVCSMLSACPTGSNESATPDVAPNQAAAPEAGLINAAFHPEADRAEKQAQACPHLRAANASDEKKPNKGNDEGKTPDANNAVAFQPVNAMCPGHSDKRARAEVTAVHRGFTVGFCCEQCLSAWNEKMAASEKDEFVASAVEPINAECPTCPMSADDEHVALHNGFAIAFCNAGCRDKWAERSEADKAAFIARHVEPVNANCPMSGKSIDADHLALHRGKTVGFCGPGCRKKFNAKSDAAKTKVIAAVLADQADERAEGEKSAQACGPECKENPCAECKAKMADSPDEPAENETGT